MISTIHLLIQSMKPLPEINLLNNYRENLISNHDVETTILDNNATNFDQVLMAWVAKIKPRGNSKRLLA